MADYKYFYDNALKRHNCHYLEIGKFRANQLDYMNDIRSIVQFDYVGPYEITHGRLGNSLRRMIVNSEFYDVFSFPEYRNKDGEELMVYAPRMFIEHVSGLVEKLVHDKYYNLYSERLRDLHRYLTGTRPIWWNPDNNFWWDTDNDFYIFFGEEHKNMILQIQNVMRENNFCDAPVGDWDSLSEYYRLSCLDLDKEALAFLRPKKKPLIRKLMRIINNKIELEKNKQTN